MSLYIFLKNVKYLKINSKVAKNQRNKKNFEIVSLQRYLQKWIDVIW